MAVEVGEAAPDFSLYDTERQKRGLSEFKGQNVVLVFFPGAFTGVCSKVMCTLRDQIGQYSSLNAQVIGISVDPPFSHKEWMDQNNVTFPFLSDFNREVVNKYDVALPNMGTMEGYVAAKRAVFVLDKEGIIRYKWVGDTPANEPDYDEVQKAVAQLS